MLSRSEEFHEGNTFDRDSSEATLSGGPVEVNNTADELFKETNKYRNQEQAELVDLFDEIDAYREDDTGAVEPLD